MYPVVRTVLSFSASVVASRAASGFVQTFAPMLYKNIVLRTLYSLGVLLIGFVVSNAAYKAAGKTIDEIADGFRVKR